MFLSSNILSSCFKKPKSITHPEPITGTQSGYRTPEGVNDRAILSSPTTIVWPALFPPWNLTTKSAVEAKKSVTLPLPSSPHWAPRTTVVDNFFSLDTT